MTDVDEQQKMLFDLMKHVTTLNTGVVVLAVAVADKFGLPSSINAVFALALLGVSLLTGVYGMYSLCLEPRGGRLSLRIAMVSLFAFAWGLGQLVIFGLLAGSAN